MNPNPLDTLRSLRKLGLSKDAKERMRVAISSYAAMHQPEVSAAPLSPFSFASFIPGRSLYAGALVALVFVGGGIQVGYSAERAVPGDVLYPIKVSVNEPLALAMATPERKVELAARFAARRVNEAATLSSKGELDAATADTLAANFEGHVETVSAGAKALEADGENAVSLAVRTDLEHEVATLAKGVAHEEVTADSMTTMSMSAKAGPPQDPGSLFAARVVESSRVLAEDGTTLESDVATNVSLELGNLNTKDNKTTGVFSAKISTHTTISASSSATSTATSSIKILPIESTGLDSF